MTKTFDTVTDIPDLAAKTVIMTGGEYHGRASRFEV